MRGPLALWAAALAALLLIPKPAPAPLGFDVGAFGRLPVLEQGRVKPLETVARSSLLSLRGRQSVRLESGGLEALPWLLDVLARPQQADRYPVFAIDDPGLLGLLDKPQASQKYFSLAELAPRMMDVVMNARRAQGLEASQRTEFDNASIALAQRVELYQRLKNTLGAEGEPRLSTEVMVLADASGRVPANIRREISERLGYSRRVAVFRPLPPRPPSGDWRTFAEGALSAEAGAAGQATLAYADMMEAWRRRDPSAFNGAAGQALAAAEGRAPTAARRAAWEALFDRAEPFYRGMIAYVTAFLLLLAALAWRPVLLRRAARALLAAGFIVHTAGLAARIALQGRPPVTNLYSSAVFVGWAAVLCGLWLERRFRDGLGALAASVIGFSTLIIAHHLAAQGDTMEMMRAVLDSNFWLTTHVVTVTLGYSAMFLASALAHVHLGRRLWRPAAAPDRSLPSMIHGVTCLALFFSFLGTVLGGIWADQSWGRFWGWDPKENGALLIVLWNAIVLHARWGGYARDEGLAVMAVFGGIITSLSWFGVNMLGVGLHSYGFMDQALPWLERFVFLELAVMAAPLLAARPHDESHAGEKLPSCPRREFIMHDGRRTRNTAAGNQSPDGRSVA